MADGAEGLERRVRAGEWLTPGEVAALLGASRATVDRMLTAEPPVLAYRFKPGTGRHREVQPESVLAELERRREVHGGAAEDPAPGDAGSSGE
jgi:hypothetical protein